jgi:A/G-specific adenine glycosylase
MDFGALHCKPQNPLCNECPLSDSCVALAKNQIKELPVKEKKIKIKKRYFNYLVPVTGNNETVLEERKGKGIWQGLYQFPLIETQKKTNEEELIESEQFVKIFPKETTISLFNNKDIVHKLSHQHLITKFWVIKTTDVNAKTMDWTTVKKCPVPVLIDKFLEEYLNKES